MKERKKEREREKEGERASTHTYRKKMWSRQGIHSLSYSTHVFSMLSTKNVGAKKADRYISCFH